MFYQSHTLKLEISITSTVRDPMGIMKTLINFPIQLPPETLKCNNQFFNVIRKVQQSLFKNVKCSTLRFTQDALFN